MLNSKFGSNVEDSELEPLLVTVPKGCQIAGIGHSKMYELIASGTVESICIGRRRLLRFSSLKTLAERGAE